MNIINALLLTLVPFAWGYVVADFLPGFYFFTILAWELVFVLFWFWVGTRFGKMRKGTVTSLALGNMAWLVSLGLYVWQFVLTDGTQRMPGWPVVISQSYPTGIISITGRLLGLFTNTITGSQAVLVAYSLMFLVFVAGFAYQRRRQSVARVRA